MAIENKRKADDSALVSIQKKSRNEIVVTNNKNKQVSQLQPVSAKNFLHKWEIGK